MPKGEVPSAYESNLRNQPRLYNHRSNEDFQTPRQRMNLTSRNQVNTHRQGSQRAPSTILDLYRDGQKSLMSSLCFEKLSNIGALASNCRSGTRLETLSMNQTPKVGSSSMTANR